MSLREHNYRAGCTPEARQRSNDDSEGVSLAHVAAYAVPDDMQLLEVVNRHPSVYDEGGCSMVGIRTFQAHLPKNLTTLRRQHLIAAIFDA